MAALRGAAFYLPVAEQRLSRCVEIGMTSRFIVPMLIAATCVAQHALAQPGADAGADINRKLAVAAAKGELTQSQVIVFREQLKAVAKTNSAQSKQQKLAAIAARIDRARNAKRSVASRFLPWF
jgi:hypothetical protein